MINTIFLIIPLIRTERTR